MRVYIVGRDPNLENMWIGRGHSIVSKLGMADIVQFIGGADVDPELYGERKLPSTFIDKNADIRDLKAWNEMGAKQIGIGVCRGGQFLNIMNGGTMWQHVGGHVGTHKAIDVTGLAKDGEIVVTSTHHQMMIPSESVPGEVLLYADDLSIDHKTDSKRVHDGIDVEAIWYERTRSLCFQPHPEYKYASKECTDYFFDLIELIK